MADGVIVLFDVYEKGGKHEQWCENLARERERENERERDTAQEKWHETAKKCIQADILRYSLEHLFMD